MERDHAVLGMPEAAMPTDDEMPMADETEKEFAASVEKRFCPNCGKAVAEGGHGRRRVFCSDACRIEWWNHNRAAKKKAACVAAAKTEGWA